MDITRLLSPTNLADFAQKWNRESFTFVGRPDRFAEVAFDLSKLKTALRERAHAVKAQYVDAIAGHTEIAINPGEIDDYFSKGMTICIQDIDKLLPELASQSVALRRSMSFPGVMNFSCYWSPESGGFALHCDDHPVFILQLAGTKKWYYCPTSSVARTFGSIIYSDKRLRDLRAIGMDIRDPDRLESVTLTPGDMLYLPAGTWHKTCAVDGQSLGLTLRCFEGSTFDLLRCMLDKHLTDHKWHEMLPPIGRSMTDELAIPPDIKALFAARLNELKDFVTGLTVMDLAHIWAERFVHPIAGVMRRSEVATDDQLRVSKNAIVLRSNDSDPEGTYWIHNGRTECKLSLADPTWFESVMQAGSFTASESCCWGSEELSWDTAKSWLEELISVELVGFASAQ